MRKQKLDGMTEFAAKSGLSTHYATTIVKKNIIPKEIARAETGFRIYQKTYFFDTPKVVDFILQNPTMFTKLVVKKIKAHQQKTGGK